MIRHSWTFHDLKDGTILLKPLEHIVAWTQMGWTWGLLRILTKATSVASASMALMIGRLVMKRDASM